MGIVRRDLWVFASSKYQPTFCLRQTRVRYMLAVLLGRSTSHHWSPKYSSGRMPATRASSNRTPYLSLRANFRNSFVCLALTHFISVRVDLGNCKSSTGFFKSTPHFTPLAFWYASHNFLLSAER